MIDDYELEPRLEEFFNRVDAWVGATFTSSKVSLEQVKEILDMEQDAIHDLNSESLMFKCSLLYGYIDSLQEVFNKEKAILEFCEESIWRIITPTFNDYGDKYSKWEFKYNSAVKENPLASKINGLKNATRARLTSIEHRIEHTKKRADILFEIAKRKKNENYA